MRRDLYHRRHLLLGLKHRGLLNQTNIEKLAKEQNVEPGTLWTDWSRRHLWLKEMAQIEQTRTMVQEILHEFKSVREEAWKTYTDARGRGSYNAAVGALHMVTKSLIEEMKFRQSLGIMEQTPTELRIEQVQSIKKAVVFLVEKVEKEDPTLLPKLLQVVKSAESLEEVDAEFLEKGR